MIINTGPENDFFSWLFRCKTNQQQGAQISQAQKSHVHQLHFNRVFIPFTQFLNAVSMPEDNKIILKGK